MAWVYLIVAGLLEIVWVFGLKHAQGFTKFWPSVFTLAGMIFSFIFLAQAIRTIPLGTGYAVWTGIGVVGTTILGMALFSEPRDLARIIFILLILFGIVGLKILTK